MVFSSYTAKKYNRKYGEIQSFQNISHMRMWMSGYENLSHYALQRLNLLGVNGIRLII